MDKQKDLMEALQRRRMGHLNSVAGAMQPPGMPQSGIPSQMGDVPAKPDDGMAPVGDPASMSPMQINTDMVKTISEGAHPGTLRARVADSFKQ